MNLTALLEWLPRRIEAGVRILYHFYGAQLHIIVNALMFFLLLNAGVMTIGLIIGKVGHWFSFIPWGMGPWLGNLAYLGSFLIALAGAISGFLWLYIWVRITALTMVTAKGSEMLAKVIKEVSRPLPSTPVEIPLLISAESAASVLRAVMGGFATLAGASAYAAIFPVYKNLTGFCVTITLCFFIAFASYAWALNDKYHARQLLVTAAGVFVLFNTVALIAPNVMREELQHRIDLFTAERTNQRELEKRAMPTDRAQHALENGLTTLQNRRDAILSRLAASGTLSDADRATLAKVNQHISKVSSGELFNTKPESSRDYTKFQSSSASSNWLIGLLALGILGWLIFGKGWRQTASSGGGH